MTEEPVTKKSKAQFFINADRKAVSPESSKQGISSDVFGLEIKLLNLTPAERKQAADVYERMFQHFYANFYEKDADSHKLTVMVDSKKEAKNFYDALKKDGVTFTNAQRVPFDLDAQQARLDEMQQIAKSPTR